MGRLNAKNIDDMLLKNFKMFVIFKHGKLRDAYSQELEKALQKYLDDQEHSERAHTHANKNEKETQVLRKGRKHPSYLHSSYFAKLNLLQSDLKDLGVWDTDQFPKPVAIKLIKEKIGGDPRTVKRYTSDLRTHWETGL